MSELQMGVYRHYKGPLYQVLGLAHDANDETRTCVVYIALQLNGAHEGPRLAVRTLEDFAAWLNPERGESSAAPTTRDIGDGATARLHKRLRGLGWRPRFEYLGPEFKRGMLA